MSSTTLTCKSCTNNIRIKPAMEKQGWVECPKCHMVLALPREAVNSAFAVDSGQMQTPLPSPAANDRLKEGPLALVNMLTKMLDIDLSAAMALQGAVQSKDQQRQIISTLPRGITIEQDTTLRIKRHWFTWGTVFLTAFTAVWLGAISLFVILPLMDGDTEFPWFISFHLLAGLGMLYKVIADYVNHTTITVSTDVLALRHGPVPWPGKKTIPVADLQQLFVDKVVTRTKNGTSTTYAVRYLDKSNQRHTLLAHLPNPEQALVLEQQIERYLGIVDVAVPGAYT